MEIYYIAFCTKCKSVWLVTLRDGMDVFAGVVQVVDGHLKTSPMCTAPTEELQILRGKISDLPAWAREKADELFATIHWSQTSTGCAFWKEAFRAANLPDITPEKLVTGTYTNGQIAKRCPSGKQLLGLLMRLPKTGDIALERLILSMLVDKID